MKKSLRWAALSVFVLTAMAFSAVGVLAMAPASGSVTPVASETPEATKSEVVGVIAALDPTSITIGTTVYNILPTSDVQAGLQIGDTVKLEFVTNPDGSLTALEVGKPEPSDSSSEEIETEPTSTEPVSTETDDKETVSTETPEPTQDISNNQQGDTTDQSGSFSGDHQDNFSPDSGNTSGHHDGGDHHSDGDQHSGGD